jgi:hypothetical protein
MIRDHVFADGPEPDPCLTENRSTPAAARALARTTHESATAADTSAAIETLGHALADLAGAAAP